MPKKRDQKRNHQTIEKRRGQLQGLPVIRRHIAGIDIGSEQHWVCAPTPDGNDREIAAFGGTTPELIRLAEWLKERQVESVAMESTGVYWIAPHEILEAQGFEVFLVDTRQLAQVPGRDPKTDPRWKRSGNPSHGSVRSGRQLCGLRPVSPQRTEFLGGAQEGWFTLNVMRKKKWRCSFPSDKLSWLGCRL